MNATPVNDALSTEKGAVARFAPSFVAFAVSWSATLVCPPVPTPFERLTHSNV